MDQHKSVTSSDTETEAPLSQEGYEFLRTIQPNLSDEIRSVLKEEYDVPPPGEKYKRLQDFNLHAEENQISSTTEHRSFIKNVNTTTDAKLTVRGSYGYHIEYEIDEKPPSKSCNYTYSKTLDKLFVQMDKLVPFKFVCDIALPAHNVEIRSYLVFKDIHYREAVVNRCPHHLHLCRNEVVSCHHVMDTIEDGEYCVCPVSKRYVTVIKPGKNHNRRDINSFIGVVRFRCTSGCRGGIDRRSIFAIFELYVNKQFKGREVIEVSVCSSPGRDRDNQEKKMKRKSDPESQLQEAAQSSTRTPIEQNVVKRVCVSPNPFEDKLYWNKYGDQYLIGVKGHENAMILRKMAEKMNELEDLKNSLH